MISLCLYHHCVFKNSSTTVKLKVVFDATPKTTTGVCLKQVQMMTGTNIQKAFLAFWFNSTSMRLHYGQLWQRFIVTEVCTEKIKIFKVVFRNAQIQKQLGGTEWPRVIYCIASSSYLSVHPLQIFADETTADKLRLSMTHDMYVDDVLSISTDFQDAEKLQDVFIKPLAAASFDIQKWATNDSIIVSCPVEI